MTLRESDLRALLAERSEPVWVPSDLAARVERRGRSRRRRRLAAGAAGAAALVAGIATTLGVAQLDAARPAPPARSSEPSAYGRVGPLPGNGPPTAVPALRTALSAVVKITATAPRCGRHLEGSGFGFARERVMTNAHLVAGVPGPVDVRTRSGEKLRGRVVVYDPRRDVAVLYVPGLTTPSVGFARTAAAGYTAVLAGFTRDRPTSFTKAAAVIKTTSRAHGSDIYHSSQVTRDILVIGAEINRGLAGGPLLSNEGTIYGMLFAAALNDQRTGYVLTAAEVATAAQTGATATHPVTTQKCSD